MDNEYQEVAARAAAQEGRARAADLLGRKLIFRLLLKQQINNHRIQTVK